MSHFQIDYFEKLVSIDQESDSIVSYRNIGTATYVKLIITKIGVFMVNGGIQAEGDKLKIGMYTNGALIKLAYQVKNLLANIRIFCEFINVIKIIFCSFFWVLNITDKTH